MNSKIAALAFAGVGFLSLTASAHPVLKETAPKIDAQIKTSPSEIRLTFNEDLVPKFSGIELKDQTGKIIQTGSAASDAKDKKQLVILVKATLSPGLYTVEWHAVAEDTHRVKGSYRFMLQP
jgi:methionine-rich copper-binding protein CopC